MASTSESTNDALYAQLVALATAAGTRSVVKTAPRLLESPPLDVASYMRALKMDVYPEEAQDDINEYNKRIDVARVAGRITEALEMQKKVTAFLVSAQAHNKRLPESEVQRLVQSIVARMQARLPADLPRMRAHVAALLRQYEYIRYVLEISREVRYAYGAAVLAAAVYGDAMLGLALKKLAQVTRDREDEAWRKDSTMFAILNDKAPDEARAYGIDLLTRIEHIADNIARTLTPEIWPPETRMDIAALLTKLYTESVNAEARFDALASAMPGVNVKHSRARATQTIDVMAAVAQCGGNRLALVGPIAAEIAAPHFLTTRASDLALDLIARYPPPLR